MMLAARYVILSTLLLVGSPLKAQSLELLETGAAATINQDGPLTREQYDDAHVFMGVMKGFLYGLNLSPLLGAGTDHPLETGTHNPIIIVPEWMLDCDKSAPSFLAFVRQHKPKGFDPRKNPKQTSLILLAWYLDQHPDSTKFQKNMSKVLLDEYFGTEQAGKSLANPDKPDVKRDLEAKGKPPHDERPSKSSK